MRKYLLLYAAFVLLCGTAEAKDSPIQNYDASRWGKLGGLINTYWHNGKDVVVVHWGEVNRVLYISYFELNGKLTYRKFLLPDDNKANKLHPGYCGYEKCYVAIEEAIVLPDGSVFDDTDDDQIILRSPDELEWVDGRIRSGTFVPTGKINKARGIYRRLLDSERVAFDRLFETQLQAIRLAAEQKRAEKVAGGGGFLGKLAAAAGGALAASAGGSNTSGAFGAALDAAGASGGGSDWRRSADGQAQNPLDPDNADRRRFDATLAGIRQNAVEADRRKAEQAAEEQRTRRETERAKVAEQIAVTNRQREAMLARTDDPGSRAQLVQQRRNADDAAFKAGMTAQVESAAGRLASVGTNRAIPAPQAQPIASPSTTAAKAEVCVPPVQGVISSRIYCESRPARDYGSSGTSASSGTGGGGEARPGSGVNIGSGTPTRKPDAPKSPGNPTRPVRPEPEVYVWKEAIAVCTVKSGKLDMCYGPRSAGVYGSERERLANANCSQARDLGIQGKYRIFGCGYGINPRANEANYAQAFHWDQIVRKGLSEPAGRQSYRCKSQFEYCRTAAD